MQYGTQMSHVIDFNESELGRGTNLLASGAKPVEKYTIRVHVTAASADSGSRSSVVQSTYAVAVNHWLSRCLNQPGSRSSCVAEQLDDTWLPQCTSDPMPGSIETFTDVMSSET